MPKSRKAKPKATDTTSLQKKLDRLEAECKALQAELEERGVPCKAAAPAEDGRRGSTTADFYKQIAAILDISADAIVSVDDRGMVQRFNRGAEDIFGYRSSEIIGRPLDVLIPERFRKGHRAHMTGFAKMDDERRLMNARGEIYGLHRDGAEFPAEASIAKLEADGRTVYTVILRDVTEREAAEAAVRDSEAMTKAVLDNLPAAVHLKDVEGRYILVNREYQRQFGWSNADAAGKTIGEMQSGQVVEATENHDRLVLETLRTQECEVVFEGMASVRTHLAVKSPVLDDSGNPAAILCVETDITERKRAEAELRQAQSMARIGTFIWDDIADVCAFCSEEQAALLGMTVAEFMANRGTTASFIEFVHPDDRENYFRDTEKASENATPYDIEFRYYDARGDLRYFREMGEPVLDDGGTQVRTFGTLQDQTDIRRAQEALRESETQLRLITDNLPAFVVYADRDHRLRFVNKTAADWYGARPEDILGKTTRELQSDEMLEQSAPRIKEVLSGKSVRTEELRKFPDGKSRYVDTASIPDFDAKGQVKGWVSLIQDITGRKHYEDALLQSEEQLRMITDNLPVFIAYLDSDQRYRFVNKTAQRWYGRAPSDFVGRTVEEIVDPKTYAIVKNRLDTVLSGEPVQYELTRLFPDGVKRTVDVTYVPDMDAEGYTRGCFALINDVTERRQAEDAARNREEQLRTVTDSIPAYISYVGKDLRFRYANRVAEQWYDMPASEIAGRHVTDILDEKSFDTMMAKLEQVLTGENIRFEVNRLFPDGVRRSVDVSYAPHITDGEVQGFFGLILDVTERRQAEDALRHREEQLRTVTDSIPAFVVFVGKDMRYLYANRVAEQWYGMPASEIIGKYVSDILDQEAMDTMAPMFEQVLAGESIRIEVDRVYPDGVRRIVDVSYSPHIIDGEVQGFFGVIIDISERRQAQEALSRTMQSGELLRRIATAANETSSAEDAIEVGLKAFCEYGGWEVGDVFMLADDESGEMVSADLWWSGDPKDFNELCKATKGSRFAPGEGLPGRVAESGKPEWIVDITKDDNFPRAGMAEKSGVQGGFAFPVLVGRKVVAVLEFFCRETCEPDQDLIDASIQAGFILGRIIERHRAARDLSESEQQLRMITDNLPVLISYIDVDQRFRFVNREMEAWYDRPAAELIGRKLIDLVGPDMFDKARPRVEGALKGEIQNFDEVIRYPDGKERNMEASYLPHFDNHGNVRGFFALVVDVTDRIQREMELRHAQRMEAVGKLTGGVAHEFNNQLAVIIGSTELLRENKENFDAAVDAINRAAVRGSELTQRLLSFSRQQPLRPAVVDLQTLIKDMSRMLSRMLGETVNIEVTPGRNIWSAHVDRGQLENAILNLAINAQHAMQRGGTLTLEAKNAKLSQAKAAKRENVNPGSYVMLAITDTGAGMPSDVLEHAFEPFFTTKEVGEGSGLGLSMVYGFVSQSGGFVEIESDEGKGTKVKIYLPRANGIKKPAVEKQPKQNISDCAGGTILVVEDDPDVRRLTVTLLASLGYSVLEAEDGEHAMPLLEGKQAIDLLLSDVVLPGDQTGPAIAEAGTRIRPDMKVLFMSGYAEDIINRDREGGQRSVDAELLSKPFTRAELASKVRATLEAAQQAGG